MISRLLHSSVGRMLAQKLQGSVSRCVKMVLQVLCSCPSPEPRLAVDPVSVLCERCMIHVFFLPERGDITLVTVFLNELSHEKSNVLHICENKDADQLRGNREADQRLCFRYTDSAIPLLA